MVNNNHITSENEYKTEPEHYYRYKTERGEKETSTKFIAYPSFTRDSKQPDINALILLYKQTSWANNRTPSDISLLISNSDIVVSVYNDTRLIGFGRIITDGKHRGLLDDIIVDEQYRLMGIGRNIVKPLLGIANTIK